MILLNPLSQKRMEELRIAALVGSAPPDDWYDIIAELLSDNAALSAENKDLTKRVKQLDEETHDKDVDIDDLEKKIDRLERRVKL